jgi:SAM-dependent methyltransferase
MPDFWGRIYRDHWSGRDSRHSVERDDGHEDVVDSAAGYFEAPRTDGERELLERLEGPVLDLAAGVGSYALHLQERGLEVTASDWSPGALEVCRDRGCRSVRRDDIRSLGLEPASFGSIIIMGNSLGAHQTPDTFAGFLTTLRRAVEPGGRLLTSTFDPLDTTDSVHLEYHERNRQRGLPPGLVRMRMKYRGETGDWMWLWMPTDEEIERFAARAGWEPVETRRDGPVRVRLFEAGSDPSTESRPPSTGES